MSRVRGSVLLYYCKGEKSEKVMLFIVTLIFNVVFPLKCFSLNKNQTVLCFVLGGFFSVNFSCTSYLSGVYRFCMRSHCITGGVTRTQLFISFSQITWSWFWKISAAASGARAKSRSSPITTAWHPTKTQNASQALGKTRGPRFVFCATLIPPSAIIPSPFLPRAVPVLY